MFVRREWDSSKIMRWAFAGFGEMGRGGDGVTTVWWVGVLEEIKGRNRGSGVTLTRIISQKVTQL